MSQNLTAVTETSKNWPNVWKCHCHYAAFSSVKYAFLLYC